MILAKIACFIGAVILGGFFRIFAALVETVERAGMAGFFGILLLGYVFSLYIVKGSIILAVMIVIFGLIEVLTDYWTNNKKEID